MTKMSPIAIAAYCAVFFLVGGDAAWADSCSARTDICNNVCYHRSGDAARRCFEYCKNEKRACLKTGLFRTTGGNYSGLDRR
jgi:hypothetical protein